MQKLFGEDIGKVVNKPGIYYIKVHEQTYIGSSIDLHGRLLEHKQILKRGKHHCSRMQNIFNKYGDQCVQFSILEISDSHDPSNLKILEKKWIDLLGPTLNSKLDPTTEVNCKTTSKIVYQYTFDGDLVNQFASCREAERNTGIKSTMISACCRGKIFSAGKFYWSYIPIKHYSYSVERSKWKWKSVEMTDLLSNEKLLFKNIAEAGRYICNDNKKFDSVCASISSIMRGIGKKLNSRYTFSPC